MTGRSGDAPNPRWSDSRHTLSGSRRGIGAKCYLNAALNMFNREEVDIEGNKGGEGAAMWRGYSLLVIS